jgi:glycosyltransferase involved in cell wall biosynthesis
MRYVLITPARNEAGNIERLYQSIRGQSLPPLAWVIVDDGSTDATGEMADRFAKECSWIQAIHFPQRSTRDFAAKVKAFQAGYESVRTLEFDVTGNVDADVSFEPDYLEFLLRQFEQDSNLGVAGTPFLEDGYDSAVDSFEGGRHVAGGCQLFRRTCFEEIGGFVANPAGGVDWIAVTTARMKGWKTRSFPEKRFHHHRKLGTAERTVLQSMFSYGEKDYYLGNSPIWEAFRIVYRCGKKPYVAGGLALFAGYCWAAIRRIPRPAGPELIRFHQAEQMQKLRCILASVVRWKRPDVYTAADAG